MAALPLLTGLGGGGGGCLAGWGPEDGTREVQEGEVGWALGPRGEGLAGADEGENDEEEYGDTGWAEGPRGEPSWTDSGAEVISHLGGIMECLGGSGSRRVSCSISSSGTKWLADSRGNTATMSRLYIIL